MQSEITEAWIKGHMQAVFDRSTLTRADWTKVEALARKALRRSCENLTWANPSAQELGPIVNTAIRRSPGTIESEIKDAWIAGYMQGVFDENTLTRNDWPKVKKLARKAWRKNCENLTWANPPAQEVILTFDYELAA